MVSRVHPNSGAGRDKANSKDKSSSFLGKGSPVQKWLTAQVHGRKNTKIKMKKPPLKYSSETDVPHQLSGVYSCWFYSSALQFSPLLKKALSASSLLTTSKTFSILFLTTTATVTC